MVPSDHVADQIVVKFGNWSSQAELVWPRKERRDAHQVDIAILELQKNAIVAQPFRPETFQASTGGLPRQLYLAAPGHRAKILPIVAPAVAYGSQWFLYHELEHGDSGGMVFAVEDGQVIPQGLVELHRLASWRVCARHRDVEPGRPADLHQAVPGGAGAGVTPGASVRRCRRGAGGRPLGPGRRRRSSATST